MDIRINDIDERVDTHIYPEGMHVYPEGMLTPPALRPGDTVAILSPASVVKREYVEGAAKFLRSEGLNPLIMPSAVSEPCGSYAATYEQRLADLREAMLREDVRAILCARGGYGCVHLLQALDTLPDVAFQKWLIGFSDISALHALWQKHGVVSLHAPMAKDMTEQPDFYRSTVMKTLRHILPHYDIDTHPYNRQGSADGILIGGNLAVIDGLAGTPYDPTNLVDKVSAGSQSLSSDKSLGMMPEGQGVILFLEDIGEKIYQVERMLYRLHLSGRLAHLSGLVIGQFTEYNADRNHPDMYAMIHERLQEWGVDCPVAFNFPAGHVDLNFPLSLGSLVHLTVDSHSVSLFELP